MPDFFTGDGVKLHFTDEGKGKPLIFVHGYGGSSENWIAQRNAMAASHRCIAIDRRWHGLSERSDCCSMARQAMDIRELIRHLGLLGVTLIGHSMGSGVIWSYLDLFGTGLVQRVITVDQSPRLVNEGGWTHGMFDLTPETATGFGPVQAAGMFAVRIAAIDDGEFRKMDLPQGPAEEAMHFMDGTRGMLRDFVYADYLPTLGKIDVPYLAVHGEHSEFYPNDSGRYLRDSVQKGHFSLIRHCDHLVPQREPEAFNKELAAFISA